jgi:hypothetical protein
MEPGLHGMEAGLHARVTTLTATRRTSRDPRRGAPKTRGILPALLSGIAADTACIRKKEDTPMSESLSRGEIQDLLSKFSKNTPSYRAALLKNPRAVLEGQLGSKIPESITIKAVEETADTMYVIVPYVPQAGAELSDSALEMVAGGKGDSYDCHGSKGGQNTRVEFNANVSLV